MVKYNWNQVHLSEEQPFQPNPRLANYRNNSPYWMPWTKGCFVVSLTNWDISIHQPHQRQGTAGTVGVLYTDSLCLAVRGTASSTVGFLRVSNALLDQVARPSLPSHRQQAGHFCHGQSLRESACAAGWASRARCTSVLAAIRKSGALWSGTIRIKLKACFTFLCSTALLCRINCPEVGCYFSQFLLMALPICSFKPIFKIFGLDLGQKGHKLFISNLYYVTEKFLSQHILISLLAYWMKFFYFSFDTNIWKGLKPETRLHADILTVGLCASLRPIRKLDSKTHLGKLIDFLF